MSGCVEVFCGSGRGKTAAAFGICVRAATEGQQAIIVRFLKGKDQVQLDYLARFEPEIQFFTFERQTKKYNDLTPEEREECLANIRNTINYTNKVISTNQCDVLVLDEALALVELEIVDVSELIAFIEHKDDDMQLIFTGRNMPEGLETYVDNIYRISAEKESKK